MRQNAIIGNNAVKQLVHYEYYEDQKEFDAQFMEAQVGYLTYAKKIIKKEVERRVFEEADVVIKERIRGLESECAEMKVRLQNCIPTNMLALFGVMLASVVIVVTLLVVQLVSNIKLVDFYLLFFMLIMTVGLLSTSIATIIYWKRFLRDV